MSNHGIRRPMVGLAVMALFAAGCGGTLPKRQVLRLTPDTLQNRVLQTRKYEGISEADLFSASTGLIQDLGFIIDESETNLGLVVGSKRRDADPSAKQRAKQVLSWVAAFSLVVAASAIDSEEYVEDIVNEMVVTVDDYQKLWASIVIRPISGDDNYSHYLRVTFQRIVWNTQDEVARLESLVEPEMYRKFFDLLSKSILLEGQAI